MCSRGTYYTGYDLNRCNMWPQPVSKLAHITWLFEPTSVICVLHSAHINPPYYTSWLE